jgi:cardiolipin synthase
VLHAKVMMIDERWFTLGSFNLNYLSTYGSIETNVESTDPNAVRQLSANLHRVLSGCEKITLEEVQKKETFLIRIRNWLSYRLMRRAFLIMTFFTFKRWGKTTFSE